MVLVKNLFQEEKNTKLNKQVYWQSKTQYQ